MTDPQTAAEAPLSALEAREKLIREHTISLHLMGEQLSQIEAWFWGHLADVREDARKELGGPLPDDVAAVPVAAPPTTEQEAHRLALSEALGLGTGAPWEAIHDRATELGLPPLDQDPVARRLGLLAAYRATLLTEAADAVFALDYDVMVGEEGDENLGSMREAWDLGTIHAEKLLRRLADEAEQAGGPSRGAAEAQPSEPPIVAYRSDSGRLLNCLRHVPPPAARHADFHPVTAEDLPDGGICTYPDCGVDVLIAAAPALSSRPGTEQEA